MNTHTILASGSETRTRLLTNAAIEHTVIKAKIDEETLKESMLAEGASHHDIAIELAQHKARKISSKNPDAMVIGCDQILGFGDQIISKPHSKSQLERQLKTLRNQTHNLLSAIVIYQNNQRIWYHVGKVTMTMTNFSDQYLTNYIARNWDSIQNAVGGYKIEEEGARLFEKIDGNYFDILGLPLLELLSYLRTRGDIE